jgi:hypothetical protein
MFQLLAHPSAKLAGLALMGTISLVSVQHCGAATPIVANGINDAAGITACVATEESVQPPPTAEAVIGDCGALAINDLIAFLTNALNLQTKAGNVKAAAVTQALIAKYTAYKATMPAGAK